jgi:hypothetical protein
MAFLRPLALTSIALAGMLYGQQPDPYPGGGPPTSGTPGPRSGQVPRSSGGPPAPPLGKKKPRSQAGKPNLTVPTGSAEGLLVSLGTERAVVLADDKRVLRFVVSPAAKFYRMEGQEQKDFAAADLKPGDRVKVDSVQDEEGETYAITITRQRPGTEEEKKRVAGTDQTLIQARIEPIAGGEPEPDERPRLRRQDGSGAAPKGKPKDAPAPAQQAEATADVQPDRPATVVVPREEDKGDEEFGRVPVIRRGKPVQTASSKAPASAPTAASVPAVPQPQARAADEWKADPPMAGAAQKEEHPILVKAREASHAYLETMPNYFCQQITTRYVSTRRHKPDFQAQDIISAEVVVENGHERYRNLQVNFKPTKKTLDEIGGSRSTGEFFTEQEDVFDPSTAAEFRYSRPETIANRVAYVFSFKVTQPHSHWTIHHPSQSYRPAYKGSMWIDKETARVLRIEMQATGLPADFPFDVVETTSDYDFVKIGAREYLVPVRAENLSCEAATGFCARNLIEFKNYRKFAAESEILPTTQP